MSQASQTQDDLSEASQAYSRRGQDHEPPRGSRSEIDDFDSSRSRAGERTGSGLQEEIVYLEAQTWEGLKSSGQALVPYLAPDCLMIFPGATILDSNSKPTLKDILTRSDMRPWTSYEMDNVHVIPLGKDAASISYEVEARRKEEHYEAMITSIWRRDQDSGDWKMCMHQQTPINVV